MIGDYQNNEENNIEFDEETNIEFNGIDINEEEEMIFSTIY